MVVLVVDDDPVTRLVVEHILRGGGHDVVVAESAEQAVAVLDDGAAFDLILCDYQMPGMSGLDLFEHLDDSTCSAPFVLLTGVGDESELDDDRSSAISGFLTKPVQSEDLLDLVAAYDIAA